MAKQGKPPPDDPISIPLQQRGGMVNSQPPNLASPTSTPSPRQKRLQALLHALRGSPTKPRASTQNIPAHSLSHPLFASRSAANIWKPLPALPAEPLPTNTRLEAREEHCLTPNSVSFSQPVAPSKKEFIPVMLDTPSKPRPERTALLGAERRDSTTEPPAGDVWWSTPVKPPTTYSEEEESPSSGSDDAAADMPAAVECLREFVKLAEHVAWNDMDEKRRETLRYAARLVEHAVDSCESCGLG
ncbi:hypothetical protein ANO11243_011030 [Dothideomycetidae sp. 11243]|nr:hypothetical protein ANO11243_011030 [fungal sp. No.11243]